MLNTARKDRTVFWMLLALCCYLIGIAHMVLAIYHSWHDDYARATYSIAISVLMTVMAYEQDRKIRDWER